MDLQQQQQKRSKVRLCSQQCVKLMRTGQVKLSPKNVYSEIYSQWSLEDEEDEKTSTPVRPTAHSYELERFRPSSPIFKGVTTFAGCSDDLRENINMGLVMSREKITTQNSMFDTLITSSPIQLKSVERGFSTPSPIRISHCSSILMAEFAANIKDNKAHSGATMEFGSEAVNNDIKLFGFLNPSVSSSSGDIFDKYSSFERKLMAPWPLV
jgi:hypothetical protein